MIMKRHEFILNNGEKHQTAACPRQNRTREAWQPIQEQGTNLWLNPAND